MITSTDQLNRQISLSGYPRKIISVVPSQTELLFTLGLENEVAGITKFCVHPDKWFRSKERVGGTKQLDLSKIRSINPDLIIANREENTREDIEALSSDYPVWISDIKSLKDALEMIKSIGRLVQRESEAMLLCQDISNKFETILSPAFETFSAIYLIWKKPFMAAGGDTFISHIMQKAGLTNVLTGSDRYPEITLEEIKSLNPQVVLLSSEPYPFKEKDVDELRSTLKEVYITLADGELFSWYGSRLLHSPPYLKALRVEISVFKPS